MARFIVAPNGIFEYHKSDLFEGLLKIEFPFPIQKEIDTFDPPSEKELDQELGLIFNRMPLSVFQQALTFMEAVWKKDKVEVVVLFRYIDGKWENFVPLQWNGMASTCYHPELSPKEATRVAGDMHLHPIKDDGKKSGSFHSSTDHHDEKKNEGIFVVVSGFTPFTCYPDVIGVVRGKRFPLKFESLVDATKYDPKPTFPPEWMERVKFLPCDGCRPKVITTTTTYAGGSASKSENGSRLVPVKDIAEWRSKLPKDKTPNSQRFKDFYTLWKDKTHQGTLFKCDNNGCLAHFEMPECPKCHKVILQTVIVESIALMIDEIDCWRSMEREKVQKQDETATAPMAAIPGPVEAASSTTPEANASDKEGDFLLVYTGGGTCNEDCPYKAFVHNHVGGTEALEKILKDFSGPRPQILCKMKEGCLCPGSEKCKNKCALEGLKAEEIPICPSGSCAAGGHKWMNCKVRELREKVFFPPSTGSDLIRSSLPEGVKSVLYCGDAECEKANHDPLTCPIKGLGMKNLPIVISAIHSTCYETCVFKGRPHEHCEFHESLVPLIEGMKDAHVG